MGQSYIGISINDIWEYNPSSNSWTQKTFIFNADGRVAATSFTNRKQSIYWNRVQYLRHATGRFLGFLGGSLWQDLPTQIPGIGEHTVPRPVDALAHGVRVTAPESALGRQLAREALLVNSRHHQAARRLGAGLEVVATSPDGLIEAMELADGEEGGWWVRAVQWHPENLVALARQRDLWRDFVEAAGVYPAPAGGRRS